MEDLEVLAQQIQARLPCAPMEACKHLTWILVAWALLGRLDRGVLEAVGGAHPLEEELKDTTESLLLHNFLPQVQLVLSTQAHLF